MINVPPILTVSLTLCSQTKILKRIVSMAINENYHAKRLQHTIIDQKKYGISERVRTTTSAGWLADSDLV